MQNMRLRHLDSGGCGGHRILYIKKALISEAQFTDPIVGPYGLGGPPSAL